MSAEISSDSEDHGPDESPSAFPRGLFPFFQDEAAYIDSAIELIQEIVRTRMLKPRDLQACARLLLGLQRLPRPTPGVHIELDLVYRCNNESTFKTLTLTEDSFELASGGHVYDPSVGGDTFSSTQFRIELHGFRDDRDMYEVFGWFESAKENDPEWAVELHDDSDGSQIEWDENEDAEEDWKRLPGEE